MIFRLSIAVGLFVVAGYAVPSVAGKVKVDPSDMFAIVRIDEPLLSPDGNHLIYGESHADPMTDSWKTEIFVVDPARPEVRRRLFGSESRVSEFRWSPDSAMLAYVSNAQVHILELATGKSRVLSPAMLAPGQIAWSFDGAAIAFAADVPGEPATLHGMPRKPNGAKWADSRVVIARGLYRDDCCGYRTGIRQLFVVRSAGGEVRQVTHGAQDMVARSSDAGYSTMTWTKDGQAIIVAAPQSGLTNRRALVKVPIVGNGTAISLTGKGDAEHPIVSPDGRWIAYIGAEDASKLVRQPHVAIIPVEGGASRIIDAAVDRWAQGPLVWSADSQSIAALHYVGGRAQITKISIVDDKTAVLASDVGANNFQSPTWTAFSGAKDTLVFPTLSTDRPAGLSIMRNGKIMASIDPNRAWAAGRSTGILEKIGYKSSADGLLIEGWVLHPSDFRPDRKYPLILDIHGGPMSAFGPGFSLQHEIYAAAGYVVVFVNPRGSNGYGTGFLEGNNRAWPGKDHDDLMSAVDLMVRRDYIDADNLFIMGRSAGGLSTTWAVGQTDRFRAASALAAVTDHSAQALTSDIAEDVTYNYFDAPPWHDIENYWRLSPISKVGKVKTPTQIIVNTDDYRVPAHEGEAFYQALKFRRVDTELVRIPGTRHVSGTPSQVLETQLSTLDWFDRHRIRSERSSSVLESRKELSNP